MHKDRTFKVTLSSPFLIFILVTNGFLLHLYPFL